ncbi:MAG: energy transducer TonB [Verrucomicrobia bacterium]|nr:energy transducer TonB [Verrucomicrobiota bacterium]
MNSVKLIIFMFSLALLVGNSLTAAENFDVYPRPINTPNPTFFGRIITSDAYVSLLIEIDSKGNVTNALVRHSSHPDLEKPTLRAVRKWEFEPAYRNGKPVSCKIVQPLTFGSSFLTSIDEKAIPLYSPKPQLAKKLQEVEGEVGVAVSVDSAGFVTRVKVLYSGDQRLNLPVLKAIRQWQYEPAKRKGRATSSKQIQPFVFGKGTKYKDNQVINAAASSISVNPQRVVKPALANLDSDNN